MRKIRVLVVDDSVVVRQTVSRILSEDPAIEAAGTAPNGRLALARIPQVRPDLVTLDLEMPEMGGLEALPEIRRAHPALPVIILSTHSEHGARETFKALALGAQDYVTKPSQLGSAEKAEDHIRESLIPKIKALCPFLGGPSPSVIPRMEVPAPSFRVIPEKLSRVDVLAIGASTGGPNALALLLGDLPGDFPVPILIVQHMPPIFTRTLAERLTSMSKIPVEEAVPGGALRPGRAWLAPGDFHLLLRREDRAFRIDTSQDPPVNSCRPAADVLFRSAAEACGAGVLAVVLTGMGRDGLQGCREIRDRGGQVVVQDQATSVVWGMPGFVAEAGLAHRVLPLDRIAAEILRRVEVGRASPKDPRNAGREGNPP